MKRAKTQGRFTHSIANSLASIVQPIWFAAMLFAICPALFMSQPAHANRKEQIASIRVEIQIEQQQRFISAIETFAKENRFDVDGPTFETVYLKGDDAATRLTIWLRRNDYVLSVGNIPGEPNEFLISITTSNELTVPGVPHGQVLDALLVKIRPIVGVKLQ